MHKCESNSGCGQCLATSITLSATAGCPTGEICVAPIPIALIVCCFAELYLLLKFKISQTIFNPTQIFLW